MFDYLIVGQGIAGSLLSWFLLRKNQQLLLLDKYNPSSSSNIAGGLIKPITGKRFVKTWLIDDLLPFAQLTYFKFEKLFNDNLQYRVTFCHLLDSIRSVNDWSLRCGTAEYQVYLPTREVTYLDQQKVRNDFGAFEINGSRLESQRFLTHYRNYLAQKKCLREEEFDWGSFEVKATHIVYKDVKARRIIFCEGAYAISNPYFSWLPFQPAKGECLIVEIDDFIPDKVISGNVVIIPLPERNIYYIGATHEWDYADDKPSEKGKSELLSDLSSLIKMPFKVLDHKAAIRPAVKDRRPFLGWHPNFPNVGIFNGMGTKGISLAPYFASHFADHMVHDKPLMPEVDIQRFVS